MAASCWQIHTLQCLNFFNEIHSKNNQEVDQYSAEKVIGFRYVVEVFGSFLTVTDNQAAALSLNRVISLNLQKSVVFQSRVANNF